MTDNEAALDERPRTCHVCRYKSRYIGVCDFCFHLVCANCCLGLLRDSGGHHEADAICRNCMDNRSHRKCHRECWSGDAKELSRLLR